MLKDWFKATLSYVFTPKSECYYREHQYHHSLFTKAASQEQSSSMEIKLCTFIAEHNLPISLSDDLLGLLGSLFLLDNTLKNGTLRKQKATNVIRQVLRFDNLKEAVSTLCYRKFSFIIDETTNKGTAKQLAILATYFDMESLVIKPCSKAQNTS